MSRLSDDEREIRTGRGIPLKRCGRSLSFCSRALGMTLLAAGCVGVPSPGPHKTLSITEADLTVPFSRPRVPTAEAGPGVVVIECVALDGWLKSCRTLRETRPGLGAHAQQLLSSWRVQKRVQQDASEALPLTLTLLYRDPKCVRIEGSANPDHQCVPY